MKNRRLLGQLNSARSRNNEKQLQREVSQFFNRLHTQVDNDLHKYWSDDLLNGQVDLILSNITGSHLEYYKVLLKYVKREYRLGQDEARRLVRLAVKGYSFKSRNDDALEIYEEYNLFSTLTGAEDDLLERVFRASLTTLIRVDQSIKELLLTGYKSGNGINYVANLLTQRFDQLAGWEAKRIARTEIHNAHNTAVVDTYKELDIEYTMWISPDDGRVRSYEKGDKADHVILNGEIIRLGDTYSNGLRYPGDTDGPLVEWINCRCANAPYIMPYGYIAPPKKQFHEDELIKIR